MLKCLYLDDLKTYQRSYQNLPNSAFLGWLPMESQPQNSELNSGLILKSFTHVHQGWTTKQIMCFPYTFSFLYIFMHFIV